MNQLMFDIYLNATKRPGSVHIFQIILLDIFKNLLNLRVFIKIRTKHLHIYNTVRNKIVVNIMGSVGNTFQTAHA